MTCFLPATLALMGQTFTFKTDLVWVKYFMVPSKIEPNINFRKKIVSRREDGSRVRDIRRALS